MLERTCRHTAKFLSVFVPGINLQNFPQDIIAKNGDQLVKIVEFYSKTSLGIKARFNGDMKKADKISLTVEVYNTVINFLRKEGALLSNIRPEYLLGRHDMLMYYKKKPADKSIPEASKLGETAHKYLSRDSWLILINQILKLYFVNKINL